MLFKQLQLFQFAEPFDLSADELSEQLEPLRFTPCLPSLPMSQGWVSPLEEEEGPLVHELGHSLLFCLQLEEKLLPASVVRKELKERIKQIELAQERKLRSKEKLSLKEDVYQTLLPKAFTRHVKFYAYIDTQNNWLVLNTTQAKKVEQFKSFFKRSVLKDVYAPKLKKLSPILTNWLHQKPPSKAIGIEKTGVLQDPQEQKRILRCQQQDLQAHTMQPLLKDGYEVVQLALSWKDHLNFTLKNDFSIRNIRFQEDLISEAKEEFGEDKQQQFDADFIIMTKTFGELLPELLNCFVDR